MPTYDPVATTATSRMPFVDARHTRSSILEKWSWTFDVSIETFILFVSAFGYDSLTRRTSSLPLLLAKIREPEYQERIYCHPVLKEWAFCLREQGRTLGGVRKDCWLIVSKVSRFLVQREDRVVVTSIF